MYIKFKTKLGSIINIPYGKFYSLEGDFKYAVCSFHDDETYFLEEEEFRNVEEQVNAISGLEWDKIKKES